MKFLLTVVLIFLFSSMVAGSIVCPTKSGCTCSRVRKQLTWKATCRGKYPKLELLSLQNISSIFLRDVQFSNTSNLQILSNSTSLTTLNIISGFIPVLNWNWLPDSCQSIRMSTVKTPPNLVGDTYNGTSCVIRPTLNVTKVYFEWKSDPPFPECLPNAVSILSLKGFPMTSFQDDVTAALPIKWPRHLRTMKMRSTSTSNFGAHVFRHAPASWKILWISNCLIPIGRLPSNLPSSLTTLAITSCGLNETTESNFANLNQVSFILFSRNKLSIVPKTLPPSLKKLTLDYNLLAAADPTTWTSLINLTELSMAHNKFDAIPPNMPASLESLDLRHNLLEYCGPYDFAHMKNLRVLKLSYNRLLNMPVNLPLTMIHLGLSNNMIALVRSKASYEFCVDCKYVGLNSNPWVCDHKFVTMLVWLGKHPILKKRSSLNLRGKCAYLQKISSTVDLLQLSSYLFNLSTSQFKNCTYNVTSLQCIDLNLTQAAPNPPLGLHRLEIRQNPNLFHIPDYAYYNQSVMTQLILSNNGLLHFPRGLPASLDVLSLSFNKIKAISSRDQETLNKLTKLRKLNLESNLIVTLYNYQLTPLTSLRSLNLINNPIHCDCSIQSLVFYFTDHIGLTLTVLETVHYIPQCASPNEVKHRPITKLTGIFDYKYKCIPARCGWNKKTTSLDCSWATQKAMNTSEVRPPNPRRAPSIPYSTYWKTLNLSGLSLTSSHVQLSNLSQLENVYLTGNRLELIPLNLPLTVRHVTLDKNRISDLITPEVALKFLPNVKSLDLRNNRIRSITRDEIGLFQVVESVRLDGNPLWCDCEMRYFILWLRASNDSMKHQDLKRLTCHGPLEVANRSLIDLEEVVYCPGLDFTKIITGSVCGVVLLILIFVAITIFIHGRRKQKEREDIVVGFRNLLRKEINKAERELPRELSPEVYKFDAFVSCCPKNEEFVFKLIQELEEKRARKLCLNVRDFTPGRSIADNIVENIGSSRRVILVISRDYVKSVWSQYEVLISLARIHDNRTGRLLVPVVIEELIDNVSSSQDMETIFALHPGIHVPKSRDGAKGWTKFWETVDGALE